MKLNKKCLNGKIRKPLILLFSLLFLGALYCLYYLYRQPADIVKEEPVYAYKHQGDIGFRAVIKPNTVFKETTIMDPGKTIYRGLMESFTATYAYQFRADQPAEIKGTYNVTATIEAKDMWKLDYVLVPQTAFSQSGKEVAFHNERTLDLAYFEQVIKLVDTELGVNAREPKLIVKTNINLEADTGEQVLKEQLAPTMIIPLTSGSFQVGEDGLTAKKEGSLTKKITAPNPIKGKTIYTQGAAIVLGALLICLILLTQNRPLIQDPRKSRQEFWRNFWKKYGDRIIKTNHEPNPAESISVNSMDDLVRVADELSKPIIYKEVFSANAPAACYVLDGPTAYKYAINTNNEGGKQEVHLAGGQTKKVDFSCG